MCPYNSPVAEQQCSYLFSESNIEERTEGMHPSYLKQLLYVRYVNMLRKYNRSHLPWLSR